MWANRYYWPVIEKHIVYLIEIGIFQPDQDWLDSQPEVIIEPLKEAESATVLKFE